MEKTQEQLLENQIKKNKTLLQSNFRLMEENEVYLSGYSKLKKHFIDSEESQVINGEEAEELIQHIMSRNMQKQRKCECSKWKQLYIKESQESLRLSTMYSQRLEKTTLLQRRLNENRSQFQSLLKDYLVLFRKFNEPSYVMQMNEKMKERLKRLQKSTEKKRSVSRGKVKISKKTHNNQECSKENMENEVKEVEIVFKLMEQFKTEIDQMNKVNAQLRQEINDKEILVGIYREKERERLLYGQFI